MANLKSHFFLLFPLLLLHHFPTVSLAQTLFVFGDGLYDAGNKQYLSQNRVDASFPPYGVTVGKATGRWSDGSIVPDYLGNYIDHFKNLMAKVYFIHALNLIPFLDFFFFAANFMGVPHISPILQTTADFSHGANFAIADATVLGSPPETVSFFFLS